MHEARTRDEWIIHKSEEIYATKNQAHVLTGKFIKENGKNEKIIFRNQLQKALNNYFKQYKKDLKNEDEGYEDLRRLFARKLDHLFDINEEDKVDYEWWKPI